MCDLSFCILWNLPIVSYTYIIFHLCQPLTSERYSLWRDHSRKNLVYIDRFKYNNSTQYISVHRETLRVSVNADHVKIIFGVHEARAEASLAISSGCRFPDRAASIPWLCAYSRASREESVAVRKNERIKRTFIWEMMRNQGVSAAQWRSRCCIREEMKRAEGIRDIGRTR